MLDANEENYFEISIMVFSQSAEMVEAEGLSDEAEGLSDRDGMHFWVLSAKFTSCCNATHCMQ